jgi:hypothetical protein
MNKHEAKSLLAGIVARHRNGSYADWVSHIDGEPIAFEVASEAGRSYQVEIQAFWDNRRGGNVRVMFSIDDGGWRAFCPLTDDLLIAEDGSFVGE